MYKVEHFLQNEIWLSSYIVIIFIEVAADSKWSFRIPLKVTAASVWYV